MKTARRSHDGDAVDARNLCRHHIHDDARWITGRATRNIKAGTLDGRNPLSENDSRLSFSGPRLVLFKFMKDPNSSDRFADRVQHVLVNPGRDLPKDFLVDS